MSKKRPEDARRKAGDDELEGAKRKLRTFAAVMAVIVTIGLLGLMLITLCEEDCKGYWPSVFSL